MKKNVLIILIAFSTLDLFSQIEKEKIIFSVDGNYMKTTTENGGITNQNVAQTKNLSIEASIGYFLSDRFITGIGFDFYWIKEYRTTELMIDELFQAEVMNIKSTIFRPGIYFGYYYPITNKLYFNTNLKFSFGKIKSEYNTMIIGHFFNTPDSMIVLNDEKFLTYSRGYIRNSEVDIFSIKLYPELTYFISSNFGLCLGLGGIEYSMTDMKTYNSGWAINFNPVYWRFGIKIKL
jgi:hypothetical protein